MRKLKEFKFKSLLWKALGRLLAYNEVQTGMDDQQEGPETEQGKRDAFATVITWSRLLITISSGILALSVTFARGFGETGSVEVPWLLVLTWLLFLVSIVSGCYLIPQVSKEQRGTLNVESHAILVPSTLQWVTFLLAVIAFICFGALNVL